MGGSTRQPIMTAYRQQALACAAALSRAPARPRDLNRLCPLFADRTQEDGKQTGRGQAHIPASHALTGQLLRLQWLMAQLQPP